MACPSNGADAVAMMRTSVKLAREQQRLVVFLEPIALYMTKDLHGEGDGLWTSNYQIPAESHVDTSMEISTFGQGKELCIISYGNGYYLSRQAEKILNEQGIQCRVIDLRWLAPLDKQGIIEQALQCDNILIVDECRQTGSISEALVTLLVEAQAVEAKVDKKMLNIKRITAQDSFIPLGAAAYHVLPSTQEIVDTAKTLVNKESK